MEVVLDLKECPNCLVNAWLMKSIMRMEVIKGNVGEDVYPNTGTKIVTNLDAQKPPIIGGRVASARVYYDICTKCGREQPVRLEKGYVTMPSRPGTPPVFA